MKARDHFVILPYIRTMDRVRFREIEFRSSRDLDGLPDDARRHLETLCRIFYLCDGQRITDLTYVYLPAEQVATRFDEFQRGLREAHLLVAYLYASPHFRGSPLLPSENATFFIFQPDRVPTTLVDGCGERTELCGKTPRSELFVEGYKGLRNWHINLWVDDTSRVFPELPHIVLNHSQNLSLNLEQFLSYDHNWAFREFWFSPKPHGSDEVRRRVFLALEWYSRSCREIVSQPEKFTNLATALESLLRVPEGKDLTLRFKNAVTTLLGPVERLDWWLDQFYDARSKTVHEGEPKSHHFYAVSNAGQSRANAKQSPTPHGPLLAYGYHVFRLCLRAVVSSAVSVSRANLAELFIPNQERVVAICRILQEKAGSPQERLKKIEPIVEELQRLSDVAWFGREADSTAVMSAVNRLLDDYKETSPDLPSETAALLVQVTQTTDAAGYARLVQLEALALALASKSCARNAVEHVLATQTVRKFLQYATQPHFMLDAL